MEQVAGFNQGKWIAIGDEEGHVSIVDGTLELPEALTPGMPDGRRATAQWVAHHNAIFDLAWFQVRELFPSLPVAIWPWLAGAV